MLLTEQILVSAGYRVMTAANGAEALKLSNSCGQPIDLLVTDVIMPEIGGSELIDKIRLERPLLPVLCLSGYVDDELLSELRGKQAEFLQKPYTLVELAGAVRAALDSRSALVEQVHA